MTVVIIAVLIIFSDPYSTIVMTIDGEAKVIIIIPRMTMLVEKE